jgi:hypothetical protein
LIILSQSISEADLRLIPMPSWVWMVMFRSPAAGHSRTMKRRNAFNPKRSLAPFDAKPTEILKELASKAGYGGNPEHKSKPSDFGLTPPTNPRAGKTLCDKARDFSKSDAQQLLNCGFVRGMISLQERDGWPQNVWAVLDDEPYEAQLENSAQGTYHGYPMPADDDFRRLVLLEWNRRGQ